jgi:hypothetical protein
MATTKQNFCFSNNIFSHFSDILSVFYDDIRYAALLFLSKYKKNLILHFTYFVRFPPSFLSSFPLPLSLSFPFL